MANSAANFRFLSPPNSLVIYRHSRFLWNSLLSNFTGS